RGGTVAPAVVRRAQVRATLHHPPRDADPRLGGIVALVLAPAARVLRSAAGLHGLLGMPRPVPVARPLPDVADHVLEAVAIGREGIDRGPALETILEQVLPGELPLPGIRHVPAAGGELLAPGIFRAVQAAAGSVLPLGLGGQDLASPAGIPL